MGSIRGRLAELEELAASLRARLPAARADLEAKLARVREAKHDARWVHAAGLALEEIAQSRSYRLSGYRTMGTMLAAEVGISRTTAHRWRAIARTTEAPVLEELGVREAYERVRPGTKEKAPRIAREDRAAAESLRKRLARLRIGRPRAEVIRREGELFVRAEIPLRDVHRLERALRLLEELGA